MKNYNIYRENPEYLVSDSGEVVGVKGKPIGSTRKDGYRVATVRDVGQRYIHRMVWESFEGDIPEGLEVNHKNGNRSDNRLDNLELVTKSQNHKHAYDVLKRKKFTGKKHWNWKKIVSVETKIRMSEAKKGKNHPKFKGWYVVDGVRYATPEEAAENHYRSATTIYRWCKEGKKGCHFLPK